MSASAKWRPLIHAINIYRTALGLLWLERHEKASLEMVFELRLD